MTSRFLQVSLQQTGAGPNPYGPSPNHRLIVGAELEARFMPCYDSIIFCFILLITFFVFLLFADYQFF